MRLPPGLALLALLALGAGPACGGPDPRPLTPREQRLGEVHDPQRRTLDRDEPAPARALLVERPLVEVTDDRLTARVLLDGELEGREVRWIATGTRLLGGSGDSASFATTDGPWTIRAELIDAGRVLDQGQAGGGGAPRIAAGWDRAVVDGSAPAGASLEIHGGGSLAGLTPGETVSVRWTGPDGTTSPWSSATAGSLPGTPTRMLPLNPLACGDREFPRRVGLGHVTCSEAGDPPVLDRWLAPTATAPLPVDDLPVRQGRTAPSSVAPASAAVSAGPDRRLVWTTDELGSWLPGLATTNPLGRRSVRGRPASDGRSMTFAGPDRVEVGRLGTSQRFQIPARPVDGDHPLALSGDWLAMVEGPVGLESLRLHDVARHRGATIAGGRPRVPVLAGRWLAWQGDGAIHAAPTDGGPSWSRPADPGDGAPAVLDDWLVVPLRSGGLAAFHLPSGLAIDLETSPGLVEARGASAGALTTWLRAPGEAGRMAEWRATHRVFEEDGAAASGDPLGHIPGGHGGTRGALAPGGTRQVELDPGPGAWLLELWLGAGEEGPPPAVDQGGRRLAVPDRMVGPPQGEPGRWEPLARVGADAGTGWEQRRLRVTWTAGPGGAIVDAVRLRPAQEGR